MSLNRIRQHLLCSFLALVCTVPFASSSRATSILPLRSEEAALLIGVDSARTSVMTMVAVPASDSKLHPDRPVRRLIGTAVALSPHRILSTASMAIPGGMFSVHMADGSKRRAELRGVDRQSNVALFSVEGAPLTPLRQASPQSIAPGSWVAVISNVSVTHPQITLGQVAGRGERVDFPYSGDIVEIEASTIPGESGGAVLNEAGDWVAIVVGRAGKTPRAAAPVIQPDDPEPGQQPSDLLIALPVDQLQRIADDLEQYGSVRHAFLGIQMRRGILPDSLGALVEGVVPRSPAERAGIRIGDRVLAFDGNVIHSAEELTALVGTLRPGDDVDMTISRGNDIFPVRASLEAAVRAPGLRPHSEREAELRQLHDSLDKLESETKRVEERIRKLEGSH